MYSIAGNDKIALTYRAPIETAPLQKTELIVRDIEIANFENSTPKTTERITSLVQVQDLPFIYNTLKLSGISIDHFYDY